MGERRKAKSEVRPGAIIAAICSYLIVCVAIGAFSHQAQPWRGSSAAAVGNVAGPP